MLDTKFRGRVNINNSMDADTVVAAGVTHIAGMLSGRL